MKRSNSKFIILRKLCALLTSFSLSLVSFPSFASGKDVARAFSGNSGSGVTNSINSFIGAIGQMGQQMNQGQPQATPEQYQAWNTLQQDVRRNIGNDQMGTVRHFMFPNCPVPPDKTAKVGNLCSQGSPDFINNDVMKYGQDYINMYKQYVGGAQNTATPVGMQCISNSMNNIKDSANTALGEMEKLLNAFEAERKAFENQQQVNIKNMKELHAELNGGKGLSSQDFKNKDFSSQFPKECNDLMNGEINKQMKTGGLVGLQDNLISRDSIASEYRGNPLASVKRQIEEDKKKLSQRIRERGIDGASSSTFFNGVKNQPLFKKAMASVLGPINEDIARINSVINELGIKDKVPSLNDPSFMTKLDTVLSKSQTTYQDKFILDCMRGTNNVSYSSSITNAIGSFTDVNVGGQGSNMVDFQNKAPGVISSANNLADLEAGINNINSNNIKIQVTNNKNQKEKKTLSQYYNDLKNECTAIYDGRLKPANGDASAENYKNMAKKAKDEIAKIKKNIDAVLTAKGSTTSFGSIEQAIDDYIYNCQGNEITTKSCSDKDTFEMGAENFCLKKATKCSSQLNSCKGLVQGYVADKTQKLKVASDMHNLAVTQLEKRANDLVGQLNNVAENMAKTLHSKLFPSGIPPELQALYGIPTNSGFQLPEGVKPINISALPSNEFSGLLLKGIKGGNLNLKEIEQQMRQNVSQIKSAISDSVSEQMKRAQDIISANEQKWEEELNAWREIISNCSGAIADKQKAIAEANKKAQEDHAERSSKIVGLCQNIKSQCNVSDDKKLDDLLETMSESASLLGPDMFDVARDCSATAEGGSEDDEELDSMASFQTFCSSVSGTKNETIFKELREQVIKNAPEGFTAKELKAIEEYMKKSDNKLDKKIAEVLAENSQFKNIVDRFRSLSSNINDLPNNIYSYDSFEQKKGKLPVSSENICSYVKKYKDYQARSTCAGLTEKQGVEKYDSFDICLSKKKKDVEYDDSLNIIAKQFNHINSSKLQSISSRMGERYMTSSCANITESNAPKTFFEQMGQDQIYNPGAFFR